MTAGHNATVQNGQGWGDDDETSARRIDRVALAADVKALSAISPVRSILAILTQWCVIILSASVAVWSGRWYAYLAAIVLIATRQHALGILVHDAAHFRLFRSRSTNDFVSDLFCALPVGIGTSVYRHFHFQHHRAVNTARDPDFTLFRDDPDWFWPKTILAGASVFVRDAFGMNFRMIARYLTLWSPYSVLLRDDDVVDLAPQDRGAMLLWAAALASSLLLIPGAGQLYLALWLLPQLTLLTAIFRLRALAEHYCVPGDDELTHTRSVAAGRVEAFCWRL